MGVSKINALGVIIFSIMYRLASIYNYFISLVALVFQILFFFLVYGHKFRPGLVEKRHCVV